MKSFHLHFAAVRKIALLIAAFALLCTAASAQTSAGGKRGFLWEIRKGAQVSYLFGTLHVGRPEFYPLPPSRTSRLDMSDAVVLEADVSDQQRAIAATNAYALYADGEAGLDTRLPAPLKKRIESLVERNQLDIAPLWRMKPWMLANLLGVFEAAQAGYAPSLASEAYLTRTARAANKPVLELESIESQFKLFDTAPFATQIDYLDDVVKSIETGAARHEINRVAQAWEAADRPAAERLLSELAAQTTPGARFTVDSILTGRNAGMLSKMQQMMADGRTYFFAVGSLHLLGPAGLVEGLRAQGYTLTEL